MGLLHIIYKKPSGKLAKDRLKILLISDRLNCSPEMMEMIKMDIAKVISKYMQVDAHCPLWQLHRPISFLYFKTGNNL